MEEMKMKSLLATLMLAMVLFVGYATSKGQDNTSNGGRIEGTWRVQVTQRNCQTGAVLRTFPAMLTFAVGGTLTGTSTVVPPAARSGDFGIWEYNGGGKYAATSEAFLFNNGAWFQTQRITQAITLSQDANTLYSEAHTEFFDTSGNVVLSGCATAVATRMTF
jgi:hypothetical protein